MISRKGLWIGLGFAVAGLLSAGAGAQTRATAAFGSLVNQILAFFPALTGEIVEVKGKELVLSIGRREGVQAGMEFSLFREGRELKHPKTGETLGRVEEELGLAVVSQVSEKYSVASLASGAAVGPGDRARVTSGKIALTVTALGSPGVRPGLVEAVYNALAEELSTTGRFRIINGEAIAAGVAQAKIPPERMIEGEGLAEPAARYRVGHLLLLWVNQVQGRPFVEARLFSFLPGRETTPLVATGLFVPSSVKAPPVAAAREQFSSTPQPSAASPPPPEAPPPKPRSFLARLLFGEEKEKAEPEQVGTVSLPLREVAHLGFPVLAMDVAVSPKDKVPRLVATDGEKVYLYRVVERGLDLEWTYVPDGGGTLFSVQLAELSDDAGLEVVANRYSPVADSGVTSFILASRDGKPVVLARDLARILFAVDPTGEGVKRALWVQPFNPESLFVQGKVERSTLRDGKLVPNGSVRVPRDFRATGATLSNITGDSQRALAYVNEQNRLVIATDGKEKWRSTSRLGGGGYMRLEAPKKVERTGGSLFYSVEPMLLAVDLDGDGVEEVLAPLNDVEGVVAIVSRGPGGYRLQMLSTGFDETVTGLGAIRGAGAPILVIASVQFDGLIKKFGETRIIMTAPR